MKIIFWGTPHYSLKSLESLIKSEHDVIAVVTQPDRKRARGKKLIQTPVKELAIANNIKVFNPEKIKNNKEFIIELKNFDCDIFIVIAYGKILSKEILDIPKFGSWNAHASLLPRWRGAAPIHWSLLSGDEYTGVGIMKMEEGLDTGDILLEERIKIEPNDNLMSLTNKLSELSSRLIINSLRLFMNKKIDKKLLKAQSNKNEDIRYARMITKKDHILNFNEEAINIFKKVRGLYPQAYVIYKNKNLKVLSIDILDEKSLAKEINNYYDNKSLPNTILGIIKNKGIIISTKTKPIILLEIKLEGKTNSKNEKLIQQLDPKLGEIFAINIKSFV